MAEENVLVDLSAVRKRRRHYETVVVVSPAVAEAAAKELLEKNAKALTDTEAVVLRKDDWGKKRMAYMMEKHGMGRYFYFRYIGTADAVRAVERSLKLDANILRYMTVQLSEPLSEKQIEELVEKAPREPSQAPSVRSDDEDSSFESSY